MSSVNYTNAELDELSKKLKVGQSFLRPKEEDQEKGKEMIIVKIETDKEYKDSRDNWIYYKYLDGSHDTNNDTCRAWFVVSHCKRIGGTFVFR